MKQTRRKALYENWKANGYVSRSLKSVEDKPEAEDRGAEAEDVRGDVTEPITSRDDKSSEKIILQIVDDSGEYGHGGVFEAIRKKFPAVPSRYERIAKMKDLHYGDVHLIDTEVPDSNGHNITVALLIAQKEDARDEVDHPTLRKCFQNLTFNMKDKAIKCSYHVSRLDDEFAQLVDEYGPAFGIPTYVYTYRRKAESSGGGRRSVRAKVKVANVIESDEEESDISSEDDSSEDAFDSEDAEEEEDGSDEEAEGSEESGSEEEEEEEEEEEAIVVKRKKPVQIKERSKSPAPKKAKKEASPVRVKPTAKVYGKSETVHLYEKDLFSESKLAALMKYAEERGTEIVDEDGAKKATLIVVPAQYCKKDEAAKIKKDFPKSTNLVNEMWLTDIDLYEEFTDPKPYFL
ncbi:unnamed protein product, partial [Mesorhabditis spiculigera]